MASEETGKTKHSPVSVRIIKQDRIKKSDTPTNVNTEESYNAGEWITPPMDMRGYRVLVEQSTILPQCIRAYKNNIAGFGIGIRYIDDVDETEEMAEEFARAEKIIELLSVECDTKEVFEDLIEARETYGIAYLEVVRGIDGAVKQIDFIRDTPSISKTRPTGEYCDAVYYHRGEEIIRKKRYCKYRQQSGGKTVYFKEFGDQRIMDLRTGEYTDEQIPPEYQANEILEFAIGTQPYGEIRWMGQLLGIDGSRKAENLNNNYFENGRHTPLMIMVKGGTLSDESFVKLQQYMNDIKGEAGQHAFILLETEATDARADFDQVAQPSIEVKDIANILQKDELFQNYLDNNRRKVQSAFQLPDLYVAYTTDFNRATAQTAQEVTEEQVFQPERKSLAWIINNKLLNGYQFKYVEVYFREPDISNPDDLVKILNVANNAGGLTPNTAREIVFNATGKTAEPYPEEWGDVPLAYSKTQTPASSGMGSAQFDPTALMTSLQQQIAKAASNRDDAVVAVMKEVKKILQNPKKDFTFPLKESIIKGKWNEEDHPRDEHGRFAGGGEEDASEGSGNSYYSERRKDLNGEYFSRPTLKLPKKEYAKVCSEISTNYSKYEGKGFCYHTTTGDEGSQWYKFENHGFGDYNIFAKGNDNER